jgi:hypothetical protein
VCAKGYFGRKRGQVGRTRTTVLQPSMAWHVFWSRKRQLPRRIATSSPSDHGVRGGVCASPLPGHRAY